MALFLIPSLAYSSTYYQVDEDEAVGYGASYSGAVADWCSKIDGTCAEQTFASIYSPGIEKWWVYRTGGGYTNNSVLSKTKSGTCPSPLVDDGNGNCVEVPQCTQGSTAPLAFKVELGTTSVTVSGDPMPLVEGGCIYLPTDPYSNDTCTLYDETAMPGAPPVLVCSASYTATGDVYTGDTSDTIEPVDLSNFTQHVDADATSSTTNQPTDTELLPDGTQVDTDSSTTTTQGAEDTTVSSDGENTTITHKEPSSSSSTTTTTTTTNPDNTSVTSQETQNTYTAPDYTTTTLDNSTGQSTGSSTTGNTTTGGGTVTTNKDANGNVTSETTTGSGNGTGNDDSTQEGNCGAPGQPPCDITLSNEDTLTDPAAVFSGSGISEQLDGYITEIESIGQDDVSGDFLDIDIGKLNLPSLGQCDPSLYDITYRNTPMNFLAPFCEKYDTVIHPVLRYFVYILTVIGLYFIYIGTVRGKH